MPIAAAAPIVAILTDFGQADGYVGVMKGVILGIVRTAQLVDLTQEIPPQDVATGAWVLHTAWRSFPTGTIFLCVVDPGVGSARLPIALKARDTYFVGPDNGLFTYVLRDAPVGEVVVLDNPHYQLANPSATFHGRDIFAPAAGHLAAGVPLNQLGTPLSPGKLVQLTLPEPQRVGDVLVAHVVHVDRFGNLITDLSPAQTVAVLADPSVQIALAGVPITTRARSFADAPPNTPAMLRDSSGHLAVVVRNGSAAEMIHIERGADVRVRGL